MKFTRGKRIALEVLGPPLLGATLMTTVFAVLAIAEGIEKGNALRQLMLAPVIGLVAVVGAYLLAGIQSVLYALVMEWGFARGLDPRNWWAVCASTLLGFASGGIIVPVADGSRGVGQPILWLHYGGIGAMVGFVLGLLIKRLSR